VITPTSDSTIAARLGIVDEHVRLENAHDLDGIMGTFGKTARYDDEPWGSHYMGRQEVCSMLNCCARYQTCILISSGGTWAKRLSEPVPEIWTGR
jgi:hypothetical protein